MINNNSIIIIITIICLTISLCTKFHGARTLTRNLREAAVIQRSKQPLENELAKAMHRTRDAATTAAPRGRLDPQRQEKHACLLRKELAVRGSISKSRSEAKLCTGNGYANDIRFLDSGSLRLVSFARRGIFNVEIFRSQYHSCSYLSSIIEHGVQRYVKKINNDTTGRSSRVQLRGEIFTLELSIAHYVRKWKTCSPESRESGEGRREERKREKQGSLVESIFRRSAKRRTL